MVEFRAKEGEIDFSIDEGDQIVFEHEDMPDTVLAHIDGVEDEEWIYALLTDWNVELREGLEEYEDMDDDEALCYCGITRDDSNDSPADPSRPWCVWWDQEYGMCYGETHFATKEEAIKYMVEETDRQYRDGELVIVTG